MKKQFLSILVLPLLVVCQSHAGVVYQDNFDGPSGANLDTLPPDVDNNGGTNSWRASTVFDADGAVAVAHANATLPFTPVDGFIYTAETTFLNNNSVGWVTFGFAETSNETTPTLDGPNARFTSTTTDGYAWMLSAADGGANGDQQAFLGPRTTTMVLGDDLVPTDEDVSFKILLDTTAGAGNWTATMYLNGTLVVPTSPLPASASNINAVGYSRHQSGSTPAALRSFSLSQQVPEPTAGVLLALCCLVGCGHRSRS